MRQIFVLSLALISVFACTKKETTGNLHIKGTIDGLSQGKL